MRTCTVWLLSFVEDRVALAEALPLLDPVPLLLVVCVAGKSVDTSVSQPHDAGGSGKIIIIARLGITLN